MASFLELIDDTLGTHFHAPVYDKRKGRAKMVALIDKAAEQRSKGLTPPTRSWKTGNNKAVSFSPKLNGNPVLIAGKETNYVPEERFQDFLDRLKAAVEKGDIDAEIEAALEGSKGSATSTSAKGSGKGSISPEAARARGIKAAATRAANKAKAAQG